VASDFRYITYEALDEGAIVRVGLNRPQVRNAQNRGLLVELDQALLQAEKDDQVRVVILGGVGPVFSSGHDLGSRESLEEYQPGPQQHWSRQQHGGTRQGAEARMLQEWHYFFTNTLRWRNLRKITIAQVQGPVLAAGLMLMWCCDLITAAEGTVFADVVGTRLGMCGLEYFAHPWEFGPRKTKELMLTGDSLSVDEAYQLGMVSKVFPVDTLADRTLDFARRIAARPTITALLIKESVNQTVDNMGFFNSLQATFTIHQLNHSHWAEVNEDGRAAAPPEARLNGNGRVQDAARVEPARKDRVGGGFD
jgi:enoyl-CoA hydratase